ncbi:MAG: hypothetical protein K2J47_05285 [Ruminococcus sp.]|nr:hypothetical protein [Ruminococcus sp.]MDE6788718.1 hypothetical protein [Ruminococcus sp.]
MKVKFHLPDFTQHYAFNMVFAGMLKNLPQYFREGVEIASVYGTFPPAIWNGGRFQYGRCSKDFVKQVIKSFNDTGIPLRFTFTNPILEKKHLHDDFCNMIMHYADNGMNEVIVASPLLEDYIRKNYPNYKITSSTCKRITEPDRLSEELENDYHIVVLDYDLNNKFDILEKIPHKEKCEILVNACCNPECGLRSEHYRSIGAEQLAYAEHLKKSPDKDFDFSKVSKYKEYFNPAVHECRCMRRSIFEIKNLSTHITPDDIWEKYVPMGFCQFKIEGRTIELFNLIEHYMYYMIKPELRDEARLMLNCQLVRQGVIQTKF